MRADMPCARADVHVGGVEEQRKTRDDCWNKSQRDVRGEGAMLVAKVDVSLRRFCLTNSLLI